MLHGISLVIRLGKEIMPTNNVTKSDDDPLKNIQVTKWTRFILANLSNSRAITPKCFWLVIKLGRDILPTNIFTKFDDYTMKTI